VSSGIVTSVTITGPGSGYLAGDILGFATFLTGFPAGLLTGSGFSVPVATITNVGRNTAVGRGAMQINYSGLENTAIGYQALRNQSTSQTTAIGYESGLNATGNNSVYLGHQAGKDNNTNNQLFISNSGTPTPLIGGDFSAGTVTVNGALTSTGNLTTNSTLKVGETSITRSSDTFIIKKNDAAATNALVINFDPSGGGGNLLQFNGALALTGSGPALSTDGGNTGQLGFDSSYLYICVVGGAPGSATWKRIALESF
jgi:hypothetical protein